MKFDQFTLRSKIIKIVATRWRILRLKCTKCAFYWGSAPDPLQELYAALSCSTPRFKGTYFLNGWGGQGRGKKGRSVGGGREERGRCPVSLTRPGNHMLGFIWRSEIRGVWSKATPRNPDSLVVSDIDTSVGCCGQHSSAIHQGVRFFTGTALRQA